MVYGLTGHAASELSPADSGGSVPKKEYQAVVHWRPQYDAGTYIDLLGRNEKTRKTYVAKVPGKGIQQAVLHYRLLDNRQGIFPGGDPPGDRANPPDSSPVFRPGNAPGWGPEVQ